MFLVGGSDTTSKNGMTEHLNVQKRRTTVRLAIRLDLLPMAVLLTPGAQLPIETLQPAHPSC